MGQIRNEKLLIAVGLSFKKVREEKKLTQEDVFNDTGIHIGRIETAKTNLTISTVYKLCSYYNIFIQDFFSNLKF
jgi:transcriptional regulator with XRE-family HTH domain